jgi:hypothetical protein
MSTISPAPSSISPSRPNPSGAIHELNDGCAQGHGWADVAAAAFAAEGRPQRVHYLPRIMLAAVAHLSQTWVRLGGRQIGPPLSPGKVRELYHRDWVCRHGLLDAATGLARRRELRGRFRAHACLVSPKRMVAGGRRRG